MRRIFVTGIGTEIGKTLISSILVEKLEADYWKPLQAGGLEETDTHIVRSLISNNKTVFHREQFRLKVPASPHHAAGLEGIEVKLSDVKVPQTSNHLVIEGAGGIMVPLNTKELFLDLIKSLDVEVVIVSKNYLGSINHTLMSVEILRQRGINILGIIFNHAGEASSEDFILNHTGLKCLGKVEKEKSINASIVEKYTNKIKI